MGEKTSPRKACAIYSDMNKLQDDINNGLWDKSEYAIIYVEDLAYVYTVDCCASSMYIDNYDIKVDIKNHENVAYTYTAAKIHVENDLRKVNFAYLDNWIN